ncbi:uncharacterized protein BXZ73DRAFT_87457 [Epithele typhae]|uniref:uncharacterized protein n=1 Tax=Epithele typhae TaxID=378194 RepID=UPI0020085500|nr:uncharacterized protein BXZ73DRAFT_87457 [Epithele typhae]KAH9943012.1 hypothetical protein BXZ73DRAFT_87457 [Epithele typhae]
MPASQALNGAHIPSANATSSVSLSTPRIKQVRGRSPGPSGIHDLMDSGGPDVRPPPKRARKAINCEPCRNSKLKCDRNRPCSSCVLRGTTSQCYQGQEADPSFRGAVDQHRPLLDPSVEFTRIRNSLALLESHVLAQSASRPSAPTYSPEAARRPIYASQPSAYDDHNPSSQSPDAEVNFQDKERSEDVDMTSAPGMLGQQASGGLYLGPTCAASHLISATDNDEDQVDRPATPSSPTSPLHTLPDTNELNGSTGEWDHDLTPRLPPPHMIDGLVQYYFEYCNWVYRHVNEPALLAGWERYKTGKYGDRLVLATVSIVIALAARYLPPRHPLISNTSETCEELGSKCYSSRRSYSLELVELMLIRSHYLTFAKEDPEETWSVRGELVTIGTAMRRRWAWWHIAFMFGRPLAIAGHHFNTQFPTYCDPKLDKLQRLYLPNIALFKLAYILGDIMDDAVSFRAVPYTSVQEKDKALTDWYDSLPSELDLDEFRIARALASPITSVRRLGVQSVIIRTAYHHIRFTLHRPYAKVPESLEIAVSAASQLIALVGQTRPDFLSNTALAVPGHMNWGPFHVFSAAMFFSFQLITKPDQDAANLFRENIRKAIASLEQSRWMPVADKALTILQALAPLYSDELLELSDHNRERRKAQVLSLVRTLAFPYQDAPYSRSADSPGYNRYDAALHPRAFCGYSDNSQRQGQLQHQPQQSPQQPQSAPPTVQTTQAPISATRWTSNAQPELNAPHYSQQQQQQPPPHQHAHSHPHQHHPQHQPQYTPHLQQQPPPQHPQHPPQQQQYSPNGQSFPMVRYATTHTEMMQQPLPHHQHGVHDGQDSFHPADESSMWGASIGFGLSEWNQFVDVMRRPDSFTGMVQQQGPTH